MGALALVSAGAVIAIGAFAPVGGAVAAGAAWLLATTLCFASLAYRFYRDPERTPPNRDDVIVSPADGAVVYVRRSEKGMLPVSTKHRRTYPLEELTKTVLRSEDATVVGIALNFLDVHVNRAPIGGRVMHERRSPGRFGSLRQPETIFENERSTIVIERGDLQVAVVMIASRLVRRIVAFVREGQTISLGDRIGMIRFGSQVDLVLPTSSELELNVRQGDRVVAGESIIAFVDRVSDETDPAASLERA